MDWKTAFLITAALLSTALTNVARAGPELGAEAVVVEATREIYDAIHKQCGVIAKNPLHLHTLVEEILIPHADFKRMGRLALGKHWRGADEAQLSEFTAQFRRLLTRTYATAVQMATPDAIAYLPTRPSLRPDVAVVRTDVRRPGEPIVSIHYHLYYTDGRWLVFDIVVDGISLVHNYRVTFAEQISRAGLAELIKTLDAKNRQPLDKDSAELISRRALTSCR